MKNAVNLMITISRYLQGGRSFTLFVSYANNLFVNKFFICYPDEPHARIQYQFIMDMNSPGYRNEDSIKY